MQEELGCNKCLRHSGYDCENMNSHVAALALWVMCKREQFLLQSRRSSRGVPGWGLCRGDSEGSGSQEGAIPPDLELGGHGFTANTKYFRVFSR